MPISECVKWRSRRTGIRAAAPQLVGPGWDTATATLRALDPHRVLSNAFLDGFLG